MLFGNIEMRCESCKVAIRLFVYLLLQFRGVKMKIRAVGKR